MVFLSDIVFITASMLYYVCFFQVLLVYQPVLLYHNYVGFFQILLLYPLVLLYYVFNLFQILLLYQPVLLYYALAAVVKFLPPLLSVVYVFFKFCVWYAWTGGVGPGSYLGQSSGLIDR